LFAYNKEKQCIQLFTAFQSWEPPIQNENQALKFLINIVNSKVEQRISEYFRNSDPFFSKIMDWVKYAIKKNNCKNISYLGKIYIVRKDINSISGKVIGEDDFNRIPLSIISDKKNFINKLFDYIQENTDYFLAIPLNQLIFRLKESSSSLFILSETTTEHIENSDIKSIVDITLKSTFNKLSEYVNKNKMSEFEEIVFKKTLCYIAADLQDGGLIKGLYKYFIQNYDGLSKDIFKEKYQK
jgi:hypothetical protein